MKGRADSVPEVSVSPTGILVSRLEILPYEHFSPVTGMNSSQQRMRYMVDNVAARL